MLGDCILSIVSAEALSILTVRSKDEAAAHKEEDYATEDHHAEEAADLDGGAAAEVERHW